MKTFKLLHENLYSVLRTNLFENQLHDRNPPETSSKLLGINCYEKIRTFNVIPCTPKYMTQQKYCAPVPNTTKGKGYCREYILRVSIIPLCIIAGFAAV